jgi:hypothetical protein
MTFPKINSTGDIKMTRAIFNPISLILALLAIVAGVVYFSLPHTFSVPSITFASDATTVNQARIAVPQTAGQNWIFTANAQTICKQFDYGFNKFSKVFCADLDLSDLNNKTDTDIIAKRIRLAMQSLGFTAEEIKGFADAIGYLARTLVDTLPAVPK